MLLGGMPNQNAELPSIESLPKEVIEILAKEIYFDAELTKIAKKSDAAKTDKVSSQIEEVKNTILRQAYMDSLIAAETTEEKITQKYTDLSGELGSKKEYKIAHIVVKTKDQAEKISQDIKNKPAFKFAEAARKNSLDKESAVDGGDLGFVIESNLIKEIADAVVKMKKDEISDPIETKFGWHLVKFTEVRDSKALPFEEVKDNIRQQLIKELLDKTREEITKDIKVEILLKAETKEIVEPKEVKEDSVKKEIAPLDDAALEEKSEERDAPKTSKE
jgi:peptidyl-prolyl cis-trans isomerase C